MRRILIYLSYIGLGLTLLPSFFVFLGTISIESHKLWMLIGTLLWFVPASQWMSTAEEDSS